MRDQIKIGASGKIVSAFDIARICALGADWVNMARPFMLLQVVSKLEPATMGIVQQELRQWPQIEAVR